MKGTNWLLTPCRYKEAFETYRNGLEADRIKYKEEEREVSLTKYRYVSPLSTLFSSFISSSVLPPFVDWSLTEPLPHRHSEQHRNYHESRGTKINLEIYDAGWRASWVDKVEGQHSAERRGHSKNQYILQHGDCESLSWEYEHGYDEAGRECK